MPASENFRPSDFSPFGTFEEVPPEAGAEWLTLAEKRKNPRHYVGDSRGTVRLKSFGLILASPIVHVVCLPICVGQVFVKLVQVRSWKELGVALLRLGLVTIAPLLLTLSAIYGILAPYQGRRNYATYERLFYGSYMLAPCFQPEAWRHLFAGEIARETPKNSW
jgi:hypothetical protein